MGIDNMSSILEAVEIGQIGVVKALILEGQDVNEFSEAGNCPILEAASRNDTNMVKLLLHFGADPNVEDMNGCTPLEWAQKYQNNNMEELIFSKLDEVKRLRASI